MEKLKSFEALLEPDTRWANLVLVDQSSGQLRPIKLQDHYQALSLIKLSAGAPEDVQSQFNVALMLGTYAWLYYPFHQIAELKAYSTVEMALHHRFPETKGSFNKRLEHAVKCGVINDHGFSHVEANEQSPTEYSEKLPLLVSKLRNDLAHGSATLHPDSLFTLRNCAEIINQLFREAKCEV
ncbi:MAG: hypothetical protein ACXWF8_07150 [Methylobacter sp.]